MNSLRNKVLFAGILTLAGLCIYFATPVYHSLKSDFLDPNLLTEQELNTEIASIEKQMTENKTLLITLDSDIEKLLPQQTSLSVSLEKNSGDQSAQCSEGVDAAREKKVTAEKQLEKNISDIALSEKSSVAFQTRQGELQKNISVAQRSLTALTNSLKIDQQKLASYQPTSLSYTTQMQTYSAQLESKKSVIAKANEDIKTAQATILSLQTTLQEKNTKITENTAKIGQNKAKITTNTNLIKSTTTDVNTAKSQAISFQSKITANGTQIKARNTQIASYQSQISIFQNQITALQKLVQTASSKQQITKLQASLTTAQASLGTAQENIASFQSQNISLQSQADTINLKTLPALMKVVDVATAENNTLMSENKNLTILNTTLQTEVTALNKSITTPQNSVKTLTAQVTKGTADGNKIQTQINALQVKIDLLKRQNQTLQSRIDSTQAQMTTSNTELESANKELTTVKKQYEDVVSQVATLKAEQNTLQSSLPALQKRFDTCQNLDAERSKLQTQLDTLSATLTDKKRDRKHYQLLGDSLGASFQSAKDALKEFKRKQITCTVVDGDYYFKRGDGSTDFSGKTLSMGSPDPYTAKFETEYSKTSVTIKADMYIDGVKVQCPDTVSNVPDLDSEPLENCENMKQELELSGEDVSGMTCTGDYSFMTEKHAPKPLMTTVSDTASSLFSNFLKSDIFGNGSDDNSGGDNECYSPNEMVNGNCVPQCNSPQIRDQWGNCSDQTCESPRELVNGTCVDGCQSPQVRDLWGSCADPACVAPNEMVNGDCIPQCNNPQIRNGDGVCVNPDCPQGQEEINGQCVAVCPDGQSRNQMGACELPACPTGQQRNIDGQCACENGGTLPDCEYNKCGNGTIDSGEECDGGEYCDTSCHKRPYCGDGNVDSNEECDGGGDCDSSCHKTTGYCGDGTVDTGEECDDGNTSNDDGCDSVCVVECEEEDGLSSSFFGWFGGFDALKSQAAPGGKKCDKPLGCPHDKPNVSNYQAGTKDPDKNQCQCDNGLDFYAGSLFFDKLHKKDNSCECDNYYFAENGKCVQDCKNGLDKEQYPDCKCPNFGDSVKNGACVPHGAGRITVTCAANIGINVAAKLCGVGWFIPMPSIGTDGKVSIRPSRSPMSGR